MKTFSAILIIVGLVLTAVHAVKLRNMKSVEANYNYPADGPERAFSRFMMFAGSVVVAVGVFFWAWSN